MIQTNPKVINVIEGVLKELNESGISFDEALHGLREQNIKSQRVLKVLLTAIGRAYLQKEGEKDVK